MQRAVEQFVDGPVMQKEVSSQDKVMKLVPQERINERIVEVPVPHFREEAVEVRNLDPQERVQEPTVEHAPHSREETVELEKLFSQERIDEPSLCQCLKISKRQWRWRAKIKICSE